MHTLTRSGLEVVVTSLTRTQVVRKGTWVRIPPAPPSFVDKRDASKNPALRCGIVACKEHVLPKNKNSRERIGAYALSVQRSSVVLAIAFSMLSGYPVVTTNRKENGQHGTEKEPLR